MDIDSGYWRMDITQCKECALICVKEILQARTVGNTGVVLDIEYWDEVKEEINKF